MLKWDKQNETKEGKSISKTDPTLGMRKEMDLICEMLSEQTQQFDPQELFDKIHNYIIQNNRLLYSQISNYIFLLSEEEIGVLQTNIDSVVNYMYGEQFLEDYKKEVESKLTVEKVQLERSKRTVLKVWDHVNLARRQYIMFHHKDADYEDIVDKKMEIAGAKISKEMNVQLISLVAIFTALSFLVFGGISSLDNIFAGAKDIPILKLVVVGSIWGFCIMNMLFVFMFFIAKISKLNLASTDDVNASVFKKYPLICWCNLVVVAIFGLSSWAVYISSEKLSTKLYSVIFENQTVFFVVGTTIIIGIVCFLAKKLYDNIKK